MIAIVVSPLLGFSPHAPLPAIRTAAQVYSSPAKMVLDLGQSVGPRLAPPLVEEKIETRAKPQPLSQWAQKANEAAGMPLFTRADPKHMHAATAATWLLGSYWSLYGGLWREYTSDDWSTFAHMDAGTALLLASGLAMAGTGFQMLPKGKNFKNYAAGLRNGMLSVALGACMAGAFMVDGWVPTSLVDLSADAASIGMLALLYDYVVEKQPWDQRPVIADLKLKMPPESAMNAATSLSLLWFTGMMAGLAHLALADGTTGLTDLADPAARAFAAQLAVGLAATPTIEAFFAGSLLYKDRFTKPSGKHVFCRELPDGEFGVRLAIQLPLQILFSFPGPAAMTVLLALSSGHADAVRQFFFLPSW